MKLKELNTKRIQKCTRQTAFLISRKSEDFLAFKNLRIY